MSVRRFVARMTVGIALLSGAWATFLLSHGGFDGIIFGLRLRSNDPSKPGWLAAVAVVLFVGLRGAARTWDDLGAVAIRARSLWRLRRDVLTGVAAGALALGIFITCLVRLAPIAGGSDSYSYLSQVDLWINGHPFVEQPWVGAVPWPEANLTFTPLGYSPVPSRHAIVPIAPPGLPLIMAAIKVVAGYRAMFLIGPLSAAVLVLATYGLGRRLGSSTMGLMAAWWVATSPVVIFQMLPPMTDVPAAAGWALACYFLFGRGVRTAVAAGLVAGVTTLIRPNLVPAAAVMGAWLVYRAWRDGSNRSIAVRRCVGFAAGLAPGLAAVGGVFWWLYGSPVRSGYATFDVLYSAAGMLPNAMRYLSWLAESQTPIAFLGLAALALPWRWLWPSTADRSMIVALGVFVLTLWGQYAAYVPFSSWIYLRFVLASFPAIMLGVASGAVLLARRGRQVAAAAVFVAAIGLGVWTLHFAASTGGFNAWRGEYKYPAVAQLVRERTDEATVVIADQHSGSVRYYGGRMTMAAGSLRGEWLDRAVAWFTDHGIHTYALLEKDEVPLFVAHFAGQQRAELDGRIVFTYEGPTTISFYDLSGPRAQPPSAAPFILETYRGPTYVLPVTPPTLVFKQ